MPTSSLPAELSCPQQLFVLVSDQYDPTGFLLLQQSQVSEEIPGCTDAEYVWISAVCSFLILNM